MDLSIIIVNYNTKELLKLCLRSIYDGYEVDTSRYKVEIIVIDNGSEDGSVEYIKNQKQKTKNTDQKLKMRAIFNKENFGFSRANNQGIKGAKGKYVLLLNSDTEIKAGALEKLLKFTKKHPSAGVVAPGLLNSDGLVQSSVYHFPAILRAVREYWLKQKGAYEKYVPVAEETQEILKRVQNDEKNAEFSAIEVEAVVGAALLIPRKIFDKIGFLDERYFMYFEDFDFCRRIKKAGLKVYYLPQAEIVHHHGASGKVVPKATRQYLVESSKIYHGDLKHYLINFIIWSGQKWQKLLGKIKI